VAQTQPGHGELRIPIDADTVAVAHVHPNMLESTPSFADVQLAKRAGIEVFVISRSGLWEVHTDGSITRVFDGTAWLK
jgi:hypothetical protein